jgi:hypothetical protein
MPIFRIDIKLIEKQVIEQLLEEIDQDIAVNDMINFIYS